MSNSFPIRSTGPILIPKPLGSHMMFIGEVTESKVLKPTPSCTYAHYHKAIKPKF